MDFALNIKSAILGFFFVGNLVFAAVVIALERRYGDYSGRWLAVFLLLCTFCLVPFLAGYQGWYGRDGYREFLFFVPFQQFLFIGPVTWALVRSQLDSQWRLGRRERWHFLPGAVYLLYSLLVFLVDVWWLDAYWFYADGRDKDLVLSYQLVGLLVMAGYAGLAFRDYRGYRRRAERELSYAEEVAYRWVGNFLVALLVLITLRVIALVLLPSWGGFGSWFYYYVAFGAVTGYIAFSGYATLLRRRAGALLLAQPPPEDEPALDGEPEIDLVRWMPRLTARMEAGLYEDPTLTLAEVASLLELNRRQVSRLINLGTGQNFNEYVNGYRVAAVERALAAGRQREVTLLAIALECGFNSKTTFNRVFKKISGRTPAQAAARAQRTTPTDEKRGATS